MSELKPNYRDVAYRIHLRNRIPYNEAERIALFHIDSNVSGRYLSSSSIEQRINKRKKKNIRELPY